MVCRYVREVGENMKSKDNAAGIGILGLLIY